MILTVWHVNSLAHFWYDRPIMKTTICASYYRSMTSDIMNNIFMAPLFSPLTIRLSCTESRV